MRNSGQSHNDENVANDLIEGMTAIAAYFGMPRSKAYHLCANGHLPGTFKLGRKVFLSKSAAREVIAKRARGEA